MYIISAMDPPIPNITPLGILQDISHSHDDDLFFFLGKIIIIKQNT